MKKVTCMNCGTEHESGSVELCYPQTDALVMIAGEQVDVKLTDCEFMAETYPETFQRPSPYVCNNVPIGMMLKVVVEWPVSALPTERFWVEVTQTAEDISGCKIYFGETRNRTLLADYGERVGPIYPRNIADVDLESFLEKYGLSNDLITATGVE
jgi:hypothetical protein